MVKRMKVGNVYLEIPEGTASHIQVSPARQPVRAEKPEEPEPLEEPQYIYRPNDPFRASIDEAHAIASISSTQKPWVKKAWFIIFIIGPLLYGELHALSLAIADSASPWLAFLRANALVLPLWLIYFFIWRRKVKS
ncbi:hypothetical protein [Ferribacterium limneticum]|uniref:hypothetical protein n=2 Tax=Ferribacterium limneticum TaxID=76259 RepID=UPI001CFC2A22|nr:hypothetical protein [Ferribacterium limneticum]UCV27191.1 hypothetical protein KI617_12970 [Ferribacterium limneticum]UCV31108.1 hypothetical protein KI608_12970 [Ferribacterium limneticum]